MDRANINETSSYYPPRARWYSPLFHFGHAARRRLHLDRLHLPAGISLRAFVVGLLVPGFAFYARGGKLIGRAVLIGWAMLAMSFLIWLGYPVANIAFGLLLSAHVSSILFLCRPWLDGVRFRFQIAFVLAVLVAVGGGVYLPLRNHVQERYLIPLRVSGRVVVVQRLSSPQSVKRGDWIAYSVTEYRESGYYIAASYGLDRALAIPADKIRFGPTTFEVNGLNHARLPKMPAQGEWTVPEKHWFVWPNQAITGSGQAAEIQATKLIGRNGMIGDSQFVGKPFKHWFGRRQLP